MTKRTRPDPTQSTPTVAPLIANDPPISRARLDRFIAQPEDIVFITIGTITPAIQPPAEDAAAEPTPRSAKPPPDTPEQ